VITVVFWKWFTFGYRSIFRSEHVNRAAAMVAEHYAGPHRVVCVTDNPAGLDPSITALPDWGDFAHVQSPSGRNNPSCYRRLRLFHPDAAQWFGERYVSLDLDLVITGDLTPIFERTEDFLMWGDTNPRTFYNGSFILMTAGARPHVWTDFHPQHSPVKSKEAGHFGSDQGWISYRLGGKEAKLTAKDGLYSFNNEIKADAKALPPDARIVFFHGRHDPWGEYAQQLPWVRHHWGDVRPRTEEQAGA
jgi:hypothetical protein